MLDYMTIGKKHKVLVVTKKDTLEGFTARWVAQKALGDKMVSVEATDTVTLPKLQDYEVLILGVEFTKEGLETLRIQAPDFVFIHNEWALVDKLHGIKNVKIDHTKTIARQAWEFFHLDDASWLIDLTESTTLWKWGEPVSLESLKKVIGRKYPMDYKSWDMLSKRDLAGLDNEGRALPAELPPAPKPEEAIPPPAPVVEPTPEPPRPPIIIPPGTLKEKKVNPKPKGKKRGNKAPTGTKKART